MSSTQESSNTLLVSYDGASMPTKELKEAIEKGDLKSKIETLKKLILLQLNGEPQNHQIMTVIKYLVPLEDHTLKKLILYFWEVVDKSDGNGGLLPEIILVCNYLRMDLQHPNEFIRGLTMRFLCKIKERDLLESLVSSVVGNLSHKEPYVRRHAVLAIQSIFTKFPQLLPDAQELMEKLLMEETDVSTRRNAFNMLFATSTEKAVRFLAAFREAHDMSHSGDVFQLAVVDFAKYMIQKNPYDKAKYVPIIFAVLQSKNPSVQYQCATTLLALSTSPTAIRHAANTFVSLLTTHSDVNVRMIVLDRLKDMKALFSDVLSDCLMDILRGLTTGSFDLRREILQLSLDLVTPKNIDAFVQFMKRELVRSQSEELGDTTEKEAYRQLVVKAMHSSVSQNLAVAHTVVPVMLDYICEAGEASYDVVLFLREVMHAEPSLIPELIGKLIGLFPSIASPKVVRTVLWLFGVHCTTPEMVLGVLSQLKHSMLPLPLTPPVAVAAVGDSADEPTYTVATTVREDGTYATSIAYTNKRAAERSDLIGVRAQIVAGDYFVAAALANALAKLVVTLHRLPAHSSQRNAAQSDAIQLMHELLTYGLNVAPVPMDDDAHERIKLAVTVAQNPHNAFLLSLVEDSLAAYNATCQTADGGLEAEPEVLMARVDQPMVFTQLTSGKDAVYAFEATADDVGLAIANTAIDKQQDIIAKLDRILPLSGFSDPVYVEATVTVHQFDILIEWFIVNQTEDVLNNLTVELVPLGDMRLCERPQSYTLHPREVLRARSSLKVSSTETGIICGSVTYDAIGSLDRAVVLLNEIYVDITDYIQPASCSIAEFRGMWSAFEWENTVVVNTELVDMQKYVERVAQLTNMEAQQEFPEEDCGFLSVSLYAKSVFGEGALANVSLETNEEGRIAGVVRIRCKTQTIALGLGEKVRSQQRVLNRKN